MRRPPLKDAHRKEKKQKELRQVYGIDDPTVTVDERSGTAQTIKQVRKTIGDILRIGGNIALVVFAIVGFLELLYPDIRIEIKFFMTLGDVLNKIIELIGGRK